MFHILQTISPWKNLAEVSAPQIWLMIFLCISVAPGSAPGRVPWFRPTKSTTLPWCDALEGGDQPLVPVMPEKQDIIQVSVKAESRQIAKRLPTFADVFSPRRDWRVFSLIVDRVRFDEPKKRRGCVLSPSSSFSRFKRINDWYLFIYIYIYLCMCIYIQYI